MNTGVLASKYNFGTNSLRLMTSAVFVGTSCKRLRVNTVVTKVLRFEGRAPRSGGQSFG